MISGACLCGTVRYQVEGPLRNLTHCHCSRCRKHHGAPFASFVEQSSDSFRWLSGEDAVAEYVSSAAWVRRFCKVCGSVVPTQHGDVMRLPVANLIGDFELPRGLHRFVGSKAPWHKIGDGLPQYDGAEPGRATPAIAPAQVPSLEGATHGSCLCRAVTFSVSGLPERWFQCHCSRCRRGRSAAHGSNTFYSEAQFGWRSGTELVQQYKVPDAVRFMMAFCTRCGGGTPITRDKVPFVLVPAALLDSALGTEPQAHIHVASKAPWFDIRDGLPQFSELPPG
jgi:hypothetical protein